MHINKTIIFFYLFSHVFISNCFSAPSINSVSGTFIDGESVTINVISPGAKSTAAPLSWLGGNGGNIESGTNGVEISDTDWTAITDHGSPFTPEYSTTEAHSGSKAIYFQFDENYSNGGWCGMRFDSGSDGGISTLYFTLWVHFTRIDEVNDDIQWKSWRVSSYALYNPYGEPDVAYWLNDWWVSPEGGWANSTFGRYDGGTASNGNEGRLHSPPPGILIEGVWQRYEVYADMGTRDTYDAYISHQIIGQSKVEGTDWIAMDDDDNQWRYIRLGQQWSEGYSPICIADVYMDDIYVDNTPSRVEIGDNATFASCTHREIQAPTAWTNGTPGSITIEVNQGSFGDVGAYLFVVDSDGSASSGFAITFGESSTSKTTSGITFGAN